MNQMHRVKRRLDLPGGGALELGERTLIMGVVNVTPDSFSDGGRYQDIEAAVAHGLSLVAQGADILDVGGESTRPGSDPVSAEEEIARVTPVIAGLARQCEAVISIDTNKAQVAAAAMAAGAHVINDVTALTGDPAMTAVAVESGAAVVLMHMLGTPKTMQQNPAYDDVVAEVGAYLAQRAQAVEAAGVARGRIIIDPGIGFGKNLEHNLSLLRNLPRLAELGYPLLLGASRKAFIGQLTGRPVELRLWGTLGAHVLGAALGADIVRVHDVAPLRDALAVCDAVMAREPR